MEQIHKKMSIRFGRTLSFPVPTAPKSHSLAVKSRSVSLPARLHPIIAQIDDEIRSLRSWQHNTISSSSSSGINSPSWIADGLARIDHLHSSLSDLLNHPQSQNPLPLSHRRRSIWADRLLDDSLRFADAHDSFRSAILALAHQLSSARSALRRRDEAALSFAARAQKETEKQLLKLAANARSIGRSGPTLAEADAQLAGVANEVTAVTAAASAAVFAGIAMLASAAMAGVSAARSSPSCVVGALLWGSAAFKKRMEKEGERWRERAMERMQAVEKCISDLDIWSQRVFRRMLNTRVFLLNAQIPLI